MGERWINGGSFLCKNPDTTDPEFITPWGAARVTANWRVLQDFGVSGVRIECPYAELLGTDPMDPIIPSTSPVGDADKAMRRGIIHKNQAARRKSRLAKAANAAAAASK